jgi:hypothetical protein
MNICLKVPFNVFKNKHKTIIKSHERVNPVIFLRTNLLSDYIDKLCNDINIIEIEENPEEYDCKYIAYVNSAIIIILLFYMFLKKDGLKSK